LLHENKKVKNIILIVDESVSYEYFDYLSSKLKLNDFYYTKSIASENCSYGSNYDIISGLMSRKVPNPSILYQYAKKNGYKTHILNGQTEYFQNGLVLKDTSYVDDYQYIHFEKMYRIDEQIIENTKIILDNNESNFIFIQKYGSHFAYKKTYDVLKKYDNKYNKMENEYLTSIEKNSIDFLNTLDKIIDKDTIVFYVSDHGQNSDFLKKSKGVSHCNIDTSSNPVPMLILNKSNVSNLNILKLEYSPNLFIYNLQAMGYDKKILINNFNYTSDIKNMTMFNN
jgi:hypothetical protein